MIEISGQKIYLLIKLWTKTFDEFLRQKEKRILWFNLGFWLDLGWLELVLEPVELIWPVQLWAFQMNWTLRLVWPWTFWLINFFQLFIRYKDWLICAYCTCLSSTNLKNSEENCLKILKSLLNLKLEVEGLDLLLWSLNVSTSVLIFWIFFWVFYSFKSSEASTFS